MLLPAYKALIFLLILES